MENNEQRCSTCDEGEFIDFDGICKLKKCFCDNGIPMEGVSCSQAYGYGM